MLEKFDSPYDGFLTDDNNGTIWIGTGKRLISFDPESEVFKEESFKKNINSLLSDNKGTLWITSWESKNLFYKKNKFKKNKSVLLS